MKVIFEIELESPFNAGWFASHLGLREDILRLEGDNEIAWRQGWKNCNDVGVARDSFGQRFIDQIMGCTRSKVSVHLIEKLEAGRTMKPEPAFDSRGYPTEDTLFAIRSWPDNDAVGWMKYVQAAWDKNSHGSILGERYFVTLHTGGWLGNESVINAMKCNVRLWSRLWTASGGVYVFRHDDPWFSGLDEKESCKKPKSNVGVDE